MADNIIRSILGVPLVPYVPQSDHLALLNTSDGEAISSWKGVSFANRSVMTLKDQIDVKFVNSFNPSLLGPSPQKRMMDEI